MSESIEAALQRIVDAVGQAGAARVLKVSRSHVCRLLSGEKEFGPDLARRLGYRRVVTFERIRNSEARRMSREHLIDELGDVAEMLSLCYPMSDEDQSEQLIKVAYVTRIVKLLRKAQAALSGSPGSAPARKTTAGEEEASSTVRPDRLLMLRDRLLEMADEQNIRQQKVYTAADIRDAIEREDVLRSAAAIGFIYEQALEFVREVAAEGCVDADCGVCLSCRASKWLNTPGRSPGPSRQEEE